MEYRNTKTGAVVEVNCEISGDWELVKAPSPAKTATKKPTKKKGE